MHQNNAIYLNGMLFFIYLLPTASGKHQKAFRPEILNSPNCLDRWGYSFFTKFDKTKKKMTDQKILKNLSDSFMRRMDNIYNVCKALADQFKTHAVTISAFKEIIQDNQVASGDNKILQASNKCISEIEKVCILTAEKMESKVIPVDLIKQAIEKAKEGMIAAIKPQPTKKKFARKSAPAKSSKISLKKTKK